MSFAIRSNPKLPKKQWFTPLPFEARELDPNTNEPRGRWQRVYRDGAGAALVLRTQPKRNTKVYLPEGLVPTGDA